MQAALGTIYRDIIRAKEIYAQYGAGHVSDAKRPLERVWKVADAEDQVQTTLSRDAGTVGCAKPVSNGIIGLEVGRE